MRSFVRLGLLASTILAAPVIAAPAYADEAPAAAEAAESSANDILVTARHRNETSQEVPVAISVLDAGHINDTGAFNVNRLQQLTPTLQVYSSNPRNTSVNIRGFGAPLGLTNDGIDQGVGIYVDDVYYSRVAAATFDFLDVSQVEVLRGPQGTLYGKNTTAGAINITSNQPTFSPEANAEVSFGNYNYFQAKAAISGPLTDNLAARIAFTKTTRRGTIYNTTTDRDNNDLNNTGVRGQLLWRPTNNLDVNLLGDYSYQNTECCATVYVKYVATQRATARQYPGRSTALGYALTDAEKNPKNRLTDVDGELRAKQSLGGASLRAKLDIGGGNTLTSISGWRFWNWDPSNDRDFTGLAVTTKSQNPSKQQQYTQELRFNHQGEKLDFQIGSFLYYQRINTDGSQVQGEDATKWLLAPADPTATTNPYNNDVINGLTSTNTIRSRNTSWSIYGQASWRPLAGLTIQPGIRLNYDRKKGSYDSVVTDINGNVLTAGMAISGTPTQKAQVGVLLPESFGATLSDWNVSYDLTVAYDITSDIHAYATYSKSFQTGGINLNGVPASSVDGSALAEFYTIKPESVHNYEVGIKSQFFNRKLTVNLAAFRTDISDYQAIFSANNSASLSTIRGYVDNVNAVRSQGIEADFSVRPSDRFNAYANFAYTDATYRDFKDAPPPLELTGGTTFPEGASCAVPTTTLSNGQSPQVCDISGQRLPGISKYSLSFGAEVNQPIAAWGHDGEAYFGVDGNWRSSFSSNATPSKSTDIDGYALFNFRLGWRTEGKGLNAYLWVRNAFAKTYFEQYQIAPSSVGLVVGNLGDPRTFGGTVRFDF